MQEETRDKIPITAVSKLKHGDLWAAVKKLGSQRAMAEALEIGYATLNHWINLRGCPSPKFCRTHGLEKKKFFELTGKTMDELFPKSLREATAFLAANKSQEQTILVSTGVLLHAERTRERLTLPSPADFCEHLDHEEVVQRQLSRLTTREQKVLSLRFGLDGNGSRTLAEIGEIIGTEKEVVRIIEARAIRDLRKDETKEERARKTRSRRDNVVCSHCHYGFSTSQARQAHERTCRSKPLESQEN